MAIDAGPYRSPAAPRPPAPRPRWPFALAAGVGLALLAWLWPDDVVVPTIDARDVPPHLVRADTVFPRPAEDLPIATPLVPILARDVPESLAVLQPYEGSQRLRRGESVVVSFNRPMVAATTVGREVELSPLRFVPAIPGSTRWLTRSSVSFTPSSAAFRRSSESHLHFVDGLTSFDGEALVDDVPRVIVLDATPRVSTGRTTIPVGAPIELRFDGPISTTELGRELFVYERGGGARTLPVSMISRGVVDEEGTVGVDLRLLRALEPGTEIAVALAPRFARWSSWEPHVLGFELAPRPAIDGIACEMDGGEDGGDCQYSGPPGEVVDFGAVLALRSTHPLGGTPTVSITPAVAGVEVAIEGSDRRYLTVRGELAPDQVYELRVAGLVTNERQPLVAVAPLAIRSAGHAPTLYAPSGLVTYERDATPRFALRGIHVDAGRIHVASVPAGREAELLQETFGGGRGAGRDDLPSGTETPLRAVLPRARPNRWASGVFELDGGAPSMRVVDFHAGGSLDPSSWTFVQTTDLGISTLAVEDDVLVWVTSIANGGPLAGVSLEAVARDPRDGAMHVVATATTDADGRAMLDTDVGSVLVARLGDDRAVTPFVRHGGTGPSELGVHGGSDPPGDDERLRAHVVTDRGLYRPGESLHTVALLRWVRGTARRPGARTSVRLRLVSDQSSIPLAASDVTSSGLGTADASFTVPVDAPLGDARIEAVDGAVVLGHADVRIAEYREPRFRVDLETPVQVRAGDAVGPVLEARYLFGAGLGGASATYSVTFEPRARMPARWSGWSFAPVGGAPRVTTLAEGALALDASGSATLDVRAPRTDPSRGVLVVEAEVRDTSGETSATTRRVTIRPADVEVGVHDGDEWVRVGEPLVAETIAIGEDDAPVEGAAVTVRFVREGWHAWWEWSASDAAASAEDGHYALRRARGREVVHRCSLASALEPVRCEHVPARGGTYVIEVEHRDATGHVSLASRRTYVAGPDESPDRDPPGAPIELTPRASAAAVGESVELAFECPWPEAEALIVVSRGGVIHSERRRVTSGGNVLSVPVTEVMAPNAFVTLTLVRPRTGPPGATLDLDAPDLRFGAAEIRVRRAEQPLTVTFDEASAETRPGTRRSVGVRVTDDAGQPVEADVVIWASDEGTLRATGWELGDGEDALAIRAAASFALEDTRRHLASRLRTGLEAEPSGDGGEASSSPMALEERERYEPTPLWSTRLRTDADGRARVDFDVPDRTTEYRVLATASDASARLGRARSTLVVTRPLVVRPALPRFLTDGDETMARAYVHNRTDAAIDAEVVFTVDGEARPPQLVHVEPRGEASVETPLHPTAPGRTEISVEARAGTVHHAVTSALSIVPRGRWARARTLVMGTGGTRDLALAFPPGTPTRGALDAVVAAHPFVGLESLADDVEATWWSTADVDAAALLALASVLRLEPSSVSDTRRWAERRAAAEARLTALVERQNVDGGFSIYRGEGSSPRIDTLVLRALLAAREAELDVDDDAVDALARRLATAVEVGSFGALGGPAGVDDRMLALRLLARVDRYESAAVDAAYEGREFLGPAALAHLALAMAPDDDRRTTLVTLAYERIRSTSRWFADLRALAALVELGCETSRHRALGTLAGDLFDDVDGAGPIGRAEALAALVRLAMAFRGEDAPELSLELDGRVLDPAREGAAATRFDVPFADVVSLGEHVLRARRADDAPVFLALAGLWSVPLSELDDDARGARVALHRVLDTPGGTAIEDGTPLRVGALVRVRLFVYLEGSSPDELALRDPHAAGLEPLDAGLDTTPNATLLSVLGASPSDDVMDPRARHALRSESYVRTVTHEAHATTYYLRSLGHGLAEMTYVARAVTPGTFTMPPAQLEAREDVDFVARSTARTVVVVP